MWNAEATVSHWNRRPIIAAGRLIVGGAAKTYRGLLPIHLPSGTDILSPDENHIARAGEYHNSAFEIRREDSLFRLFLLQSLFRVEKINCLFSPM